MLESSSGQLQASDSTRPVHVVTQPLPTFNHLSIVDFRSKYDGFDVKLKSSRYKSISPTKFIYPDSESERRNQALNLKRGHTINRFISMQIALCIRRETIDSTKFIYQKSVANEN